MLRRAALEETKHAQQLRQRIQMVVNLSVARILECVYIILHTTTNV